MSMTKAKHKRSFTGTKGLVAKELLRLQINSSFAKFVPVTYFLNVLFCALVAELIPPGMDISSCSQSAEEIYIDEETSG